MKVHPPRDIRPFVMYCVNGKPRSSLLIESTDSMIFILILILLLQWTYRDSVLSSDARLHVDPFSSATWCANVFSVTRPSLNRSFTIKHTVSLSLRRHSCTQSKLATSIKRHSDLIPYLARGSLGTRARAPSTHVRRS